MFRWIDVQIELPPNNKPVLVYAKDGLFDGQDIYIAILDFEGRFVHCDVEGVEISNPTHWKELPERP